jgi:hypothetical protein
MYCVGQNAGFLNVKLCGTYIKKLLNSEDMVFTSTIQILPHADRNPTPAAHMYSTPHFSIFFPPFISFVDGRKSFKSTQWLDYEANSQGIEI